jgi:ADP-ribosylglycohydrolase
MPSLRERLEGGVLGLLVGDATGVPYEFHRASGLPPAEELEPTPPPDFRRAHIGTPPGTWSDDGAQALALLDSLLERGRLDPDDLGRRLVAWHEEGAYAVDRRVFDVGIRTATALRSLARGGPALGDPATADTTSNGNGSLMRVLPLALWHRGSDAELVRDARLQSRVTHPHRRAQLCCALYVLWARRTLEGAADAWAGATSALRAVLAATPDPAERAADEAELEFHIRPDDGAPGRGSGYVVDCLRSARWAVSQGGYEQVVKAAIALGDDTDTTACVAGGLAGLRDGVAAIPPRWLGALRGRELVDPLLARLVARAT